MPEPSPNEPHQLRPLLQHERHRDEPAVGGRGFEEAVSEWGRFTAQDQAEWETDSPEKFFGDTYDHFLFLTKTSDLLERIWPAEKVICFATPVLRRRKTGRRILHAEEVSGRLFLSGIVRSKGNHLPA